MDMKVDDKALLAAFNRLDKALQGKALGGALEAGAMLIVNQAKEDAPYKSGTLKRSLHIGGRTSLTPDYSQTAGNKAEYGDIRGNEESTTTAVRLIGTNLVYARKQEYTHPTKAGYLRRAYDSEKSAVVVEVKEALADIIAAAVK
jgi:hypothetical protein